MKNLLIFLFLILFSYVIYPSPAYALENPTTVPNNKFGIHILFTEELPEAARLINSNGGEWGYVTIPIQSGDRNMEKWQKFMNLCKENKVIPIIRLATEGDYFNTKVWRKPKAEDVLDFANFLNSLEWPTKNRYIIVFNEVNRSDEWGGSTSPEEYARILNYAIDAFKTKHDDFFIISAGMDNAAATVLGSSYSQYSFFQLMEQAVPGIFNRVDGLSSHSYPNPAFAQPPTKQDYNSIASFRHESEFIRQYTSKQHPIFITETGWSKDRVPEETIARYLHEAFSTVWNTNQVVAVTPFLLRSGAGLFVEFSYLKPDGAPGAEYKALQQIKKVKGTPALNKEVLGIHLPDSPVQTIKDFSRPKTTVNNQAHAIDISPTITTMFKWLLQL